MFLLKVKFFHPLLTLNLPRHILNIYPQEFDDGCGEGEIDLGNGICTDDESVASRIREIQADLAEEDAESSDNASKLGRRFSMGGVDDFSSVDNMRTKRRTQRLTLLMAKVEGQQRNVGKFRPREFMKKINGYGKLILKTLSIARLFVVENRQHKCFATVNLSITLSNLNIFMLIF